LRRSPGEEIVDSGCPPSIDDQSGDRVTDRNIFDYHFVFTPALPTLVQIFRSVLIRGDLTEVMSAAVIAEAVHKVMLAKLSFGELYGS
jgi:hypothetical protein